ncbi:MAG: hypothetical protein E7402_00880 [Ruminococcaceae bacterium]|nr:hypothetical protein [Oscillospiraceae bacterium]
MGNVILIVVLAGLVGGASYYLYREKKKGATCIGCPYSKSCQSRTCSACSQTAECEQTGETVEKGD